MRHVQESVKKIKLSGVKMNVMSESHSPPEPVADEKTCALDLKHPWDETYESWLSSDASAAHVQDY